jgi:hypothetical protein
MKSTRVSLVIPQEVLDFFQLGRTHIIISVKNEEEEEVEEASVLYYQSIVLCLGGGGTLRIKLLVYKYSSRQPNKRERHFLCAIFFKQRKNKSRRRTSV